MTRKQHLQKLPLQKRLQAMENARRYSYNFGLKEILEYETPGKQLLSGIFNFMNSRQGHDYWMNIDRKYFG